MITLVNQIVLLISVEDANADDDNCITNLSRPAGAMGIHTVGSQMPKLLF